jgi:hypothetical protein
MNGLLLLFVFVMMFYCCPIIGCIVVSLIVFTVLCALGGEIRNIITDIVAKGSEKIGPNRFKLIIFTLGIFSCYFPYIGLSIVGLAWLIVTIKEFVTKKSDESIKVETEYNELESTIFCDNCEDE